MQTTAIRLNFEASSKDRKQTRPRSWRSFGEIYLSLIELPPTSNTGKSRSEQREGSNPGWGKQREQRYKRLVVSWCSHPVGLKTRLKRFSPTFLPVVVRQITWTQTTRRTGDDEWANWEEGEDEMATSQSGKRKLIPHAQKDGLFRVESERESRAKGGKRQGRNTEGWREQIEPDAVKGTVFSPSLSLSLCFCLALVFPLSLPGRRSTDDLQATPRSDRKCFPWDYKHRGTLEKTSAKINRLWRCVMKYACSRSWHSLGKYAWERKSHWRSEDISAVNCRSFVYVFNCERY